MTPAPALHGDIPVGNWIDRWAPKAARPYLRLMRIDRPIGTWLLLFPCWWSAALAAEGWPDPWLFALFAIGAVVMRGAGCTVNDIADHKFDAQVERTRGRPIPSGTVSLWQAAAFLGLQLAVGLLVLVQLNPFTMAVGAASLLLVFPYPLMKRITYWPQAWLGLTFNWGALVGWAAVTGGIGLPALLLYAAGIVWTLGYDTIYAHQDKDDDALIGVKSTALRLGDATPRWLVFFYGTALALIAAAGWSAGLSWAFWPLLALAGAQLAWQVATVNIDDSADCLSKFKSNRFFGWALLAAIVAGKVVG
ncbi:MAG TPA: 4-hydroxybenzoate octaprenyltransferase [Candidatus Omnitrophota bacterium]|nr:4-hydroxybenzoate octaprenyltransferase [Candidatus Omnitrophota bacterium]